MKIRRAPHWKTRGLIITRLMARDGPRCAICAGRLDRTAKPGTARAITIDHRLPKSLGGTDEMGNLRLAHNDCNLLRGDAYDPDFDR